MVTLSKKDIRKGKSKAAPVPAKPVVPAVESGSEDDYEDVEDDGDDDEEEEDEEEDEEDEMTEEGMKRLMALISEEDLDEFEKGLLAAQSDDDEEGDEEDDEEDDEEEEEEEDDEMLEDEEDEDDDEELESDADAVLMESADPDALRLDDLDSNASLDEDAVPMRKVTANNKPAMRILTEGLKVTHLPWPETLVLQSKDKVDADPADDLKREMAFYKVALDQVAVARKLAAKHDIPFTRPNDYYAEMVKSDEHMERIRSKLVDEAQGIKKSEAAKRQRDLKKYGKQIQVEKLKQREADKKQFAERVQGVKRKRKEGAELGDDFEIDVDDAMEDRPQRGSSSGRGRGRGGGGADKPRMPRSARDNKYSLGGGGRRAKQNTKESTADFGGWGGGGGRGGRGGARGGRGGARGGGGRGGGQRPGKSRRK